MTDKYGVTSHGFNRKRLPEQLQDIYTTLRSEFGEQLELTPDTVLGILAANEAERYAEIWQVCEQIYNAMYPMSATGSNLDRVVSFTGVERLQAQPSAVDVIWYGAEGTEIPEYTVVRNIHTQVNYYSVGDFTISKNNAYDVELIFNQSKINVGESVQVTINGVQYRYQTDRSSVNYAIEQLANRLKNLEFVRVSSSKNSLRLIATTVMGFRLDFSQNLTLSRLGTLNEVQTEGASTDVAEIGQLSEIVHRINGLDSVNNVIQGSAGREMESDSELYARYALGVYHTGAGTVESLVANLLKIKGVTEAFVYENASDSTDQFNTPAHSLHCIVQGGLDADIARAILRLKPAGIPTFGTTTLRLKDSQNVNKTIRFSRPKKRYIWIKVIANTFVDQSESAPTGYIVNILNKIMQYGEQLTMGSDVILQRIIGKCVEVSGVSDATVTIGVTNHITDPEPNYSDRNITIAPNEWAVFDKSIISIG